MRRTLHPFWLIAIAALLCTAWCAVPVHAQDAEPATAAEQEIPGDPPAPPALLIARDVPNDAGRELRLFWRPSPDESLDPELNRVSLYRVYRAIVDVPQPEFEQIAEVHAPVNNLEDKQVSPGVRYLYQVTAVGVDGAESEPTPLAAPAVATAAWFNTSRAWLLVLTLVISAGIILFIYLARTGRPMRIRKIAGLEAVDEAVGRATEMGRSILFVPGIQDMNNIQTVAGLTVLARIGRTAAEYGAHLEVPTSKSLVMTTARETLESSYLAAGRPDAYNEDNIYYVTDEQFGYVAYLTGHMVRHKPAACFYLGAFFAESLILAETGNSIGAIQVAGTAEPAQLPFFVAACDYTLIGEEFFAASAYLSGEPEQLGSLKGQDMGKIVGALILVFGCIIATMASVSGSERMAGWEEYLKVSVLGTEATSELGIDEDEATIGADPATTTGEGGGL